MTTFSEGREVEAYDEEEVCGGGGYRWSPLIGDWQSLRVVVEICEWDRSDDTRGVFALQDAVVLLEHSTYSRSSSS